MDGRGLRYSGTPVSQSEPSSTNRGSEYRISATPRIREHTRLIAETRNI
jgi:hypothetical protein